VEYTSLILVSLKQRRPCGAAEEVGVDVSDGVGAFFAALENKIEATFERSNIKTTDDVKEALIRVGQHKPATVTPIAERSATR
jgi:hypothetical protein